jgi:HlyD family secretion protein
VNDTGVFRKVALDRLASPEQLDQLVQVVNPRGWLALAALGAVILTAVVWSIVGVLPENVMGQGMLLRSGGVFEVVPTAGGRITDIAVGVGDQVHPGQVVARLAQPQLSDQLNDATAALDRFRADRDRLVSYDKRQHAIDSAYTAEQRTAIQQSATATQQSVASLTERVRAEEQLVTQGLLTRPSLLNTRQQLEQAQEKVASLQGDLTQLEAKDLSQRNDAGESERSAAAKIVAQEAQVAEYARQLRSATEITAPYTGRVLDIMTEPGRVIGAGEPVLTLDLTGRTVSDLEAVVYVRSADGKRVRPGMPIQIAPATVKQEEYGLMLGKVTYVSDFPATPEGMLRVLENQRLVTALSGQDAPYEVHADLELDPRTSSHYRWSSSGGPPVFIQSGTIALGYVEVTSQRPIEMVIPLLRKWTGI